MVGLDQLGAPEQRQSPQMETCLPHLDLDRPLAVHEDGCLAVQSVSKVFWGAFLWLVLLVHVLNNSLLFVGLPRFVPADLSRSKCLQYPLPHISLQCRSADDGLRG